MNIITAHPMGAIGPALLLVAIGVPSGCTDGSTEAIRAEVTDSAGISIVRSVSEDLPLRLESEPVLALGGKDTPEESFYSIAASTVATDGDGNLYVLEWDAYRVQVFDSTGTHQRTLGRQGGGPGELQYPFGLAVAAVGRVWVVDVGKRALVGWTRDGDVLPQEPLPVAYSGGRVEWTPSGLFMPLRDSLAHHLALIREAGEPQVLASLPLAETRSVELTSCGMFFGQREPIFSPSLTWTAAGNTVVVARNPDYVLDVYEDGRLVRSIRRDLPPRPASEELARASLGEGWRVGIGSQGREVVCDPAEVVEQQGFAPYLPMVGALAYAPDATLWVQRYTVASDPSPIDLFDPDGRYIGTLPEGSPFPIGFLPDGRILVSETDELDVQRLVVRTVQLEQP